MYGVIKTFIYAITIFQYVCVKIDFIRMWISTFIVFTFFILQLC